MSAREYQYWILGNEKIKNKDKKKIIEYFGDSKTAYLAPEEDYLGLDIKDEVRDAVLESRCRDIYRDYQRLLDQGIDFVTTEDSSYPEGLRNLNDCPYGFWYRGTLPDIQKNNVAIVGARACSNYGQKVAYELSRLLGESGYSVVSGMAKGIDSYGHQGALDGGGKTVAVLGCGVDVVYPAANRQLYNRILENGCVMSEFSPQTQPLSQHFPSRNRIIAALSKRLVVVEAKEKSGSLITADFAMEQGKDVYAVPGRLTDAVSAGCNRLIEQGAGIIRSLGTFVAEIYRQDDRGGVRVLVNDKKGFFLDKKEMLVYGCLDYYPKSLSALEFETMLSPVELMCIVVSLVQKGLVVEVFKNQYAYRN